MHVCHLETDLVELRWVTDTEISSCPYFVKKSFYLSVSVGQRDPGLCKRTNQSLAFRLIITSRLSRGTSWHDRLLFISRFTLRSCLTVNILPTFISYIFYWIRFLPSSPEHSFRESPLHMAVRWGLYRLAELLLCQPGGLMAVSLPNEEGVTPLQLAQTAGNTELLELLTQ